MFDRGFNRFRDGYGRMLEGTLHHRVFVLICAGALLVVKPFLNFVTRSGFSVFAWPVRAVSATSFDSVFGAAESGPVELDGCEDCPGCAWSDWVPVTCGAGCCARWRRYA